MKNRYKIILLVQLFAFCIGCAQNPVPTVDQKIDGLTLVAPPYRFATDPMIEVNSVNAGWIALVPYAFIETGSTAVSFGAEWQWWGETVDGVRECVNVAHNSNIKVMVKPQVYMHKSWVGDLDYSTEKEWQSWEQNYRKYILEFAHIAADTDAEMFCIGTEFKIAIQKREQYWRSLITEIRTFYAGKITYSSNWDSYQNVLFWDDLDYIGLSAYFPLTEVKTPIVSELTHKWKSIKKKLKKFSRREGKPILFTEYGYMSIDKCAWRAWEIEQERPSLMINELAQANALEALYQTYWDESWWAGGFMWKWFPNGEGHEGYPEKDYTPQGKEAEKVLKKWFSDQ